MRVKILTQLPRNSMEKNTSRDDGLSVQVIGDENILRARYKNSRQTCRHHFGQRLYQGKQLFLFPAPGGRHSSVPETTELNELKKKLKRNEHERAEVALELRASRERIGILEAELVELRESGGGTDLEARSAPNGSAAQCVLGPRDCSVSQGCESACEVAEAQEHLSFARSLFHETA